VSTALRTYYRGHNLAAMRDSVAATNRYYHIDHQGTTQCLTDSMGAVTDRFAADAWGVQVKRTGTALLIGAPMRKRGNTQVFHSIFRGTKASSEGAAWRLSGRSFACHHSTTLSIRGDG
jgi:hypothetical protein